MDPHQFLSRLPAHKRTEKISAAVNECLKVASDFAAAKASLKTGDRLTSRGVSDTLRDAVAGYAARLAAARKPIDALATEAKTRRAAMKPKGPEPSDLATALAHSEIRQFLRGMSPLDRMTLLTGTKDVRLLEAALASAPELVGITDEASANRIEDHWLQLAHAAEVEEIEAIEQLANEATAAALTARDELRRTAEMDDSSFTAKVGGPESQAALPWIKRDGDRVLVVEIDENGSASYRPATEFEAKAGVEYENLSAYNAARGL